MRFKLNPSHEEAIRAAQKAETAVYDAEQRRARDTDPGELVRAINDLVDAREASRVAWERVDHMINGCPEHMIVR
jgi:hypothetical protein